MLRLLTPSSPDGANPSGDFFYGLHNMEDKKKGLTPVEKRAVIIATITTLFCGWVVYALNKPDSSPPKSYPSVERFEKAARSECQSLAASKAKHARKYKQQDIIGFVVNGTAHLEGHIDFLNSYGAYIPHVYQCRYKNVNGTPSLINFTIEEE
jgi:hypothetical protein